MVYMSYYGNVKNLLKKGFKKEDLVRISVYECRGLSDIEVCEKLFPSEKMLWDYKNGVIDWKKYRNEYLDYLYSRIELKFWWDFEKKFEGKVLLCFEKENKFCHRKLIKDFYKYMFGKDVIMEV